MNKPSLVKFMTKAAPLIITELDAALRSRAFDGYSLIEDEQDKQVRRLYTLDNSKKDGVMVSGVTWSNAGKKKVERTEKKINGYPISTTQLKLAVSVIRPRWFKKRASK